MPNFAIFPSLKGKVVIVTGGAQGIGAAMVKAFAAQGSRVGFLDKDEGASAELTNVHENVIFEICDLRDIDQMKAALEKLTRQLGHADVLVNNAARDDRHDWQDVTPEY